MSDYELIQKCLSGDQQCFEQLVVRYKKLIFSVVYNMINNREEASDISQEVFLRIYKSLGRYNPEYKFSTWAVKIATNLCLDVLRKRKTEDMPIEEIEGVSKEWETPENSFLKKEKRERVRKAINELPEKYRVPIVLYHQNGVSYEEMTKILNVPMSIVKNRLYRARLMLKEKLSPDGKEEII